MMGVNALWSLFLGSILASSSAFLFDETGVVKPVNPYSFIGDVLNLTCNVTNNDTYPGNVSEFLYFTKMYGEDEWPLPPEYITILDSRSILLEYPVTSGEDQGPYTCLLNRTSEDDKVVNSQAVTVEHRPRNITEIDPVVDDWKSMTVTWDLGQDYINPDLLRLQVSWTINLSEPHMYACPHNTTTSCSWREDDGTDSFKMMTYHIHIGVATFRRQGRDEVETARADSVFVVEPRLFVKPAPVQDLTVVDRNSTCISLSWAHSQNSQLRTLRHTVLVTQDSQLQQNISTEETDLTVCDLTPATVYTFNISCIPIPRGEQEPRGYNSEWTAIQNNTLEDVVQPNSTYVFIGDTLNLTCNMTDSHITGNVSESLFFTKMIGTDEIVVPLEYTTVLDSRSIQLVYPATSREDQGPYTCLMNRTYDNPKIVNRVEHPPLAVKKLHTVVYDWRSMTTTWELGQEHVNPDRIRTQLVWTILPRGREVYECPHPTITSCTWRENDGRDSFKNMEYYMRVQVSVTNASQSGEVTARINSAWFQVDTRLFVKPAPIQDLAVVDRNSTCISLSWTHSQSSQLRTVRHTVLVTQDSQLQQNISTEETDLTVCDLTPATEYTFNISCIPIPSGEQEPRGYNSEWTAIQNNTLEDVTTSAPCVPSPTRSTLNSTDMGDLVQLINRQLQLKMKELGMMYVDEESLLMEQERLHMNLQMLVLDWEKLVMEREKIVLDRENLVRARERLITNQEGLIANKESAIERRKRTVRN